jgi:hypothetical protein
MAGLAFGVLAGMLILHQGLGMIFLLALFAGTAIISIGLYGSRLFVASAVWLGQYLVFYWSFVRPLTRSVETEAPVFITHSFFVFLPGMVVVFGAYMGLLAERIYRTPGRRSRLNSPPARREQ